MIQVSAKYAA